MHCNLQSPKSLLYGKLYVEVEQSIHEVKSWIIASENPRVFRKGVIWEIAGYNA